MLHSTFMKEYSGRRKNLKGKINHHLTKLTGKEADYFAKLKHKDLLELKSVLTDIHNVLTLRLTLQAVRWLGKKFSFEKSVIKDTIIFIDGIKPNTSGFDIKIDEPKKIIAEVKCIVPVNDGDQYGGAQWNGILDDAIKLKKGNKKLSETSGYLKFIFLLDLGAKTNKAIEKLLKDSRSKSDNQKRIDRHAVKKHIELLDKSSEKLNLDKVYVVKLK
jgi:hypothetical protein